MTIHEAIPVIMGEIGAIGKDKKNQQQGFMYRGVDDVMNALSPILAKYKVFIVPEVLEHTREERTTKNGGNLIYSVCKVAYTFYSEDGSSVRAVVSGEGMDSADKSSNKAMSVAYKYACFQVFCIPTEEMLDPDAETHQVEAKQSSKQTDTICSVCGKKVAGVKTSKGTVSAVQVAERTKAKYGKVLCSTCAKELDQIQKETEALGNNRG